MDAHGLLGGRPLRKPAGGVGVVAVAVDEHGGAHVPRGALSRRAGARVRIGARIVDQNAGGLMCGAALRVARAEVAVVARAVVQDAQALEVAAALAVFADRVDVVAGEIVDSADPAGGIAAEPQSETLAQRR